MSRDGLPTLDEILNGGSHPESPLARTLSVLFESSPILVSTLSPQVGSTFDSGGAPTSYSQLIDLALSTISNWEASSQAHFIAGHPRIGENKNLSNLSAKEQGSQGVVPTPPEVLARLSHLNACYEAKYPGLRYITFVNGRTRAAIAEEMEDKLGIPHNLSSDTPSIDAVGQVEADGAEWGGELTRGIHDIGRIAKSRLGSFGVV